MAGLFALACGAQPEPEPVSCQNAALLGGTPRSEFVAMAEVQERAVCAVKLVAATAGVVGLCSGTLVTPDLVLTAAHCLAAPGLEAVIDFGADVAAPVAETRVVAIATHPSLDLALLRLEAGVLESAAAYPIPIGIDAQLSLNTVVQIAGTGFSAQGVSGIKQFAVSRIQALGDAEFTVFAEHRAGACAGDSGGPALIRDGSGRVVVAGVLSHGSSSCTDSDSYISLAGAREWLESYGVSARDPSVLADCGLVGSPGRCFGDAALWCDGNDVLAERCDLASRCGFSGEARGFRCVAPGADLCQGIGDRGDCNGDERVLCIDGAVVTTPCSACNASCETSVRTGAAICNALR